MNKSKEKTQGQEEPAAASSSSTASTDTSTAQKAPPMTDLPPDLSPGKTHMETLEKGLKGAGALHKRVIDSNAHAIEHDLQHLIEGLEKAAEDMGRKEGKPVARLANMVKGLHQYLDTIRDEHMGDAKKVAAAEEAIKDINTVLRTEKGNEQNLTDALLTRFKRYKIPIPGELKRSNTLPMHEEYLAQVKDHLGEKKLLGKAVAFAASTVSLGVVAHGMTNIKRGIFGYQDMETGEQKGGALSTLIVGIGETAAGLSSLKWALTGRWGTGRATHAEKHDHHHHDHHHGHSH